MSEHPVKTAQANVERFRVDLVATLGPFTGEESARLLTATIEGLILAHIQKTVASMMGRMP